MKPTKAQIRKWVKALRSGEYAQGRHSLQTKIGFCCLGVACKVFIKPGQLVKDSNRLTGTIPMHQLAPRWLTDVNDDFAGRAGQSLTSLNDNGLLTATDPEPFTFDEIADVLEAVYIYEVLA